MALAPDGQLRQVDEAAALLGWRSGTGTYWIDIGCDQPAVVTAWLAGLGIEPELLELFQIDSGETKILPLTGAIYLSYPIPAGEESAKPGRFGLLCLDRSASDLQQRHAAAQQEAMNRRLALLTTLWAIFMPLTLIVGIYGMNFEVMPELHFRYGYPVVLGVMGILAGGLAWYFRSRWWST